MQGETDEQGFSVMNASLTHLHNDPRTVPPSKTADPIPGSQTVSQLALLYATKSTVHGLPSTVAHTFYKGQRHFWIVLVIVMTLALGTVITLQLHSYYEWPSVISSHETHLDVSEIPDVTVCTQDNVDVRKYSKDPWASSDPDVFHVMVHTEYVMSGTGPSCDQGQTGQCLLEELDNMENTKVFAVLVDKTFTLGQSFYKKVITSNGRCDTFQTQAFLRNVSSWRAHRADVPLHLIIGVNPRMFPAREGMQITLHPEHLPPFPETDRIPVPVMTRCRVDYKKVTRKSLTTPYKSFIGEQCVELSNFRNPLSRYSVYTKDTCLAECFVNFTIAQCGCRYYLHPGSEPLCNMTTILTRMEEARGSFNREMCACPPLCEDTHYETSVACTPLLNEDVKFFHLELVSSSGTRREITQTPVHTLEGILSNLGGLIGLFMGFSLVSIIELVELFVLTISRCMGCTLR